MRNDGTGIPVVNQWKGKTSAASIYLPQALLTEERCGSNFNDKEDPDRVSGGINGLGLKIVASACKSITLETVDSLRSKYFSITCLNNFAEIQKPIIRSSKIKDYTKITFLPDYDNLCKLDKSTPSKDWLQAPGSWEVLESIVFLRCYQITGFIQAIKYRYSSGKRITHVPCKFFLQGQLLKLNNHSYAEAFGFKNPVVIDFSSKDDSIKFPWILIMGARTEINSESAIGFEINTVVNGIWASEDGSSHTNMMFKRIREYLGKKIKQDEVPEHILKKALAYFDFKQFPFKAFDFNTQTKDKICIAKRELNAMKQEFIPSDQAMNKLWDLLKPVIMMSLKRKDLAEQNKLVKTLKLNADKYQPAYDFAKRKSISLGLSICEGDSAEKTLREVLIKSSSLNSYGIYKLTGVPMNALKQIEIFTVGKKISIRQSENLKNNLPLQGLVKALGLDYEKSYDFTSAGESDFLDLPYKFILMATDQDMDGIGHICSLVMVFLFCFWPDLLKRSFFRRFETPIIRAFWKNHCKEFYSQSSFEAWLETTSVKPKEIMYYKGLADHSLADKNQMAKNFSRSVYTYSWDDISKNLIRIMYGNETVDRKTMLSTPVSHEYSALELESKIIPISQHLLIEAKSFQLMNMRRKIRCAIDGLIPVQRMALYGARKQLQGIKVFQITGKIANELHYAHGETSMNGAIQKLTQCFTGANHFPVFQPVSDGFGSRRKGREDNAAPRYSSCKLNPLMNLLFPRDDLCLLSYSHEEGRRNEPKYFVPVVPLAILEHENTTGTGWKIDIWARDFAIVMQNIKALLKGRPQDYVSLTHKPWLAKGMSCRIIDDKEYCIGDYELIKQKPDFIRITQLPLRVWSMPFCCDLTGQDYCKKNNNFQLEVQSKQSRYIQQVRDYTVDNQINIEVELQPGALQEVLEDFGTSKMCAIEDFCNLGNSLTSNINMICEDGYIREFPDYDGVFFYWFEFRKKLYISRRERMLIIMKLKAMILENLITFIQKGIQLKNLSNEQQETTLEKHGFVKFNSSILKNSEFIPTLEIEKSVLHGSANYSYILDLRERDKSLDSIKAKKEKLETLHDKIEFMEESTWANIWMKDLLDFEVVANNQLEEGFAVEKLVYS